MRTQRLSPRLWPKNQCKRVFSKRRNIRNNQKTLKMRIKIVKLPPRLILLPKMFMQTHSTILNQENSKEPSLQENLENTLNPVKTTIWIMKILTTTMIPLAVVKMCSATSTNNSVTMVFTTSTWGIMTTMMTKIDVYQVSLRTSGRSVSPKSNKT